MNKTADAVTGADGAKPVLPEPNYNSFFIPMEGILPAEPVVPAVAGDPADSGVTPPASTDPPEVTPQANEPAADLEPNSSSVWKTWLHYFRDEAKAIPSDFEIPDDLSEEDATKKIVEGFERAALEKTKPTLETLEIQEYNKLLEKGRTAEQIEQAITIAEHLAAGGSEQAIGTITYLDQLAQFEPENEEEELEVLRRLETYRGQDPKIVEVYLKSTFIGDENKEARKAAVVQAKAEFAAFRDEETALDKERARVAQANAQKAKAEERKRIESEIDKGIFGVRLPDEEANQLKKLLFEVVGYGNVQTSSGIKKVPQTAETQLWTEIFANPQKRAAMTYIAAFGVDKVIGMVGTKNAKNLLHEIESHTVPSKTQPIAPVPVIKQPPQVRGKGTDSEGFILKV